MSVIPKRRMTVDEYLAWAVDPERPRIIHHARSAGDTILTRIVTDGRIRLEPPGLEIAIDDIYA